MGPHAINSIVIEIYVRYNFLHMLNAYPEKLRALKCINIAYSSMADFRNNNHEL